MPDISTIILNWNNKDVIVDCLDSVLRETQRINSEIIVVDNGSTDGSLEMIKRGFPEVRLIKNKENLGFGKGVNQGIGLAKGKNILLLGSDTVAQKGSLRSLLESLQNAGSEYVAVAPQLLNEDGTIQSSCRKFPTLINLLTDATKLWKVFPKSKVFGNYRLTYWNHNSERDVVQPQMTCMLIRKDVFDKVGLIDAENFPIWFNDVDWSHRLYKAGYKIRFIPRAKVTHLYGQSVEKLGRGRKLIWRDGLLNFYKKWYPGIVHLPARIIIWLLTLLWVIV